MSGHPRILDPEGNEIRLFPSDYLYTVTPDGERHQIGFVTIDGDLVLQNVKPPASPAVTHTDDRA